MIVVIIIVFMTDNEISNQIVVLCTGARVPLLSVAAILMSLETLNTGTPSERAALVALRKTSLKDQSITPDASSDLLVEAGLIDADYSIPEAVRQVVLASIRGEADGIYLGSPYTDLLDRAISDLIISLAKVGAVLPPEQLATILRTSKVEGESWVQKAKRGNGDGCAVPQPSPN